MRTWPHAPVRVTAGSGAIMVTSSTYHKEHFFSGHDRLSFLQSKIFEHCEALEWRLQAWAVFPNHFHIVALAPDFANLERLMKRIHGSTGDHINKADGAKGRMVWYRDWPTPLTYEKSYLDRLRYVHDNAVHHGLVACAQDYPYCSATWFELKADRPFYETVMSFPIDRVKVYDEF